MPPPSAAQAFPLGDAAVALATGQLAVPRSTTKLGAFAERLTTWMGPGPTPAVMAPPGTLPRAWDYTPGFNLGRLPRQHRTLRFAQLRALSRNCWQIRCAIETWRARIRKLDWQIVYQDADTQKLAARRKTNDPRITQVTAQLRHPKPRQSWREWIGLAVDELQSIDAWAVVPWRNQAGGLYGLRMLAGDTILQHVDTAGETPLPPEIAYTQTIRGATIAEFTADELLYFMANPSVDRAYGTAPAEWIELVVNVAMRREFWRLDNYTAGSIPEALIGLPEGWGADKIHTFQLWWDSLHDDNQAAQHGARFIPSGPGMQVWWAKEKLLQDEVDEFLARIACWAFNLPPTWAVKMMNRATAEVLAETSFEEGQAPLMAQLDDMMDVILASALDAPDLGFRFKDPRSVDPVKKAQIVSASGVYLLDEARAEFDLEPLGVEVLIGGTGGQPLFVEELRAGPPEPQPVPPQLVDPNAPRPNPNAKGDMPNAEGNQAGRQAGEQDATRVARAAAPRQRRSAHAASPSHRSRARNAASWPAAPVVVVPSASSGASRRPWGAY